LDLWFYLTVVFGIILVALTASSRIADKVELIRGSEKVKIIPLTSGILLAIVCLILLLT